MKTISLILLAALAVSSSPTFAEEASTKEGLKTAGEGLVNGTALMGMTGATSAAHDATAYDGRRAGAKTWTELGDMHRAARPGVANFGK
jgi:hypothetical protein